MKVSKIDLLLLMTMVFWGINFTVVKLALREMNPLAFNALRFSLASIVLLAWNHLVSRSGDPIGRKLLTHLFLIGLIGNTVYQMAFIFGIQRTSAGIASLILASVPIFVTIISRVLRLEYVGVRGWLGIVASFLGIALMVNLDSLESSVRSEAFIGDLLILTGTICWSVYTIVSRPMLATLAPVPFVTYTVALGTPPLVALSVPSLLAQDYGSVSLVTWTGLIYSALLANVFAYLAWYSGVKSIGSARTTIYSNLNPVVAVLFAWQVLGEQLLQRQIVGAALVFLGIYLTRFGRVDER